MELKQLGREYEHSARLCRERAAELRLALEGEKQTQSEYIALHRRITMLETMARQAAATGRYLLNYYGEEVLEIEQDSNAGISKLEALFEEAGQLGKPASPYARRGHRAGADAAPGADGAHVHARQAQMVRMYFLEQHSIREMAAILGVYPSTVSRTLAAARTKLKRCLRYGAKALLDGGDEDEDEPY